LRRPGPRCWGCWSPNPSRWTRRRRRSRRYTRGNIAQILHCAPARTCLTLIINRKHGASGGTIPKPPVPSRCLSELNAVVLFLRRSPGGLGADAAECAGGAGHHQPCAQRHDAAHRRQPGGQLSGTAAAQQEPEGAGHTVEMRLLFCLLHYSVQNTHAVILQCVCVCVCSQVWKEACSHQGRGGERDSGSGVQERQRPHTPPVPRLGPGALSVAGLGR